MNTNAHGKTIVKKIMQSTLEFGKNHKFIHSIFGYKRQYYYTK